jgi:predicted membrane channel-forming protein YqfA (hemolysin III family)
MIALVLWIVALVLACLAITAPNGFPLLLAAVVFYALAWGFYKPKEVRRR